MRVKTSMLALRHGIIRSTNPDMPAFSMHKSDVFISIISAKSPSPKHSGQDRSLMVYERYIKNVALLCASM
jgi:hypothetical protein